MTDNDFNIRDRHVSGDADVFGNARVSGNAEVSGNARVGGNADVFGNARVSGNAEVSGNAWVSGDAEVSTGIIDGCARIASSADLCQIVHEGCVWSRFPQADGSFRTTSTTHQEAPGWLIAALDAWEEARRG